MISNYIGIKALHSLVVWQIQGHFSSGDTPWNYLPKVGGSDRMRGYNSGQYRDEQMIMGQVEYRQHIYGRHGMVVWGGAATLANDFEKLGRHFRLGYRFCLKEYVNRHFDYGFGRKSSAFYFNVNEAF